MLPEIEDLNEARETLAKLTTAQVRNGMRTFEINGKKSGVLFKSCFIAMLYGEVNELHDDYISNGEKDEVTLVVEKFGLSDDESRNLSWLHYIFPEQLLELCNERLAQEPADVPA